jgi:hypothetical protein
MRCLPARALGGSDGAGRQSPAYFWLRATLRASLISWTWDLMRSIPLVALAILLCCVRSQSSSAPPVNENPSVVFPDFYGSPAIAVGERDKTYALDGIMLRALMVAAHDLMPPEAGEQPCWETLEARGFQVIRQGDIVFVSVHADLARCGQPFLMLDSGVKYAISADGRILRRAFDHESGAPAAAINPDAGPGKLFNEPGLSTVLKPPGYDTPRHLPPGWRDGGSGQDGGSRPESVAPRTPSWMRDGGVPSPVDAGT